MMELNIKKTGTNTYFLDVRVRKNGKRLRKRETFFGTKVEAQNRFFELKRVLLEGESFTSNLKINDFGELLQNYAEKRGDISKSYLARIEQLQRDLGNIPPHLFPDKFDQYLKIIRNTPTQKTRKKPANATINRLVEIVRAAYNLAFHMELIDKNPITKRRFPKLKEISRDRVLTPDEIQRLFAAIDQNAPYLKPLVKYAIQIPCRKSELTNMRIEDLDLINEMIRVRNGTTKNDQGCYKPIPPDMVEYFRTLPKGTPYLFYRLKNGQYCSIGDFKKSWTTCLKIAGIKDFRFHDTRHVSATNLLNNGTPEQVVLDVAGWKTNMLKNYYHRSGKDVFRLIRYSSNQVLNHQSANSRSSIFS